MVVGALSGRGCVASGSRGVTRVGLDARLTAQMSVGMKTYVRELTERLPRVAPEFEYVVFDGGGNFGWQEQVQLPLAMRRARIDLAHFLTIYVPVLAQRPFVLTVHDLIHLRFPKQFKSKVGPYYRTVVKRACSRAARVITDDERTARDLQHFLSVRREKVRVIPLGVSEQFFNAAVPHRGVRPYLLYVGNHRAHKDLPTLFDAWSALSNRSLDLFVTGPDDFGGELARRSSPQRRIVALGDVPETELAEYYAGAVALIHPSRAEGFGLPLLEALAVRCPVIVCEDAAPGVLAAATLTFPAGDAGALRAQIERVLDDEGLRVRLGNHGHELARSLTWDVCARATADVYREALEDMGNRCARSR
jgi:O-antigen biosynthesis alpha-1,2-mannosyltransferase